MALSTLNLGQQDLDAFAAGEGDVLAKARILARQRLAQKAQAPTPAPTVPQIPKPATSPARPFPTIFSPEPVAPAPSPTPMLDSVRQMLAQDGGPTLAQRVGGGMIKAAGAIDRAAGAIRPYASFATPALDFLTSAGQNASNVVDAAGNVPEEVARLRAEGVGPGRVAAQAGKSFAKEAVGGVAEGAKGISSLAASLNTIPGFAALVGDLDEAGRPRTDETQMAFYRAGQAVQDWMETNLPDDPALRDTFLFDTLPGALGSGVGFIAQAALARGVGGNATAAIGTSGAVAQASTARGEARAHGVTDPGKLALATAGGAALGTTEAVGGVGTIARRMFGGTATRGLRAILREAIPEAIEEAGQEAIQGIGGNLLAQKLYDKGRGIFEGAGKGAATGGAAGFLLSVAVSMLAGPGFRNRQINGPDDALAVVEEGIQALPAEERAAIEQRLASLRPDVTQQAPGPVLPPQSVNAAGVPTWVDQAVNGPAGGALVDLSQLGAQQSPTAGVQQASPSGPDLEIIPLPKAEPLQNVQQLTRRQRQRARKLAAQKVEEKAAAPEAPSATFAHFQETGLGNRPYASYVVKGGPLDGSHVSAETLKAQGIPIPETPETPPAPPQTAKTIRRQIRAVAKSDAETDAAMALIEARAKAAGESVDAYIGKRLAGVEKGGTPGAGALKQNIMEQTKTPEFKAFFGESKVVDEATGAPLMVFHGSPDATFTEFNEGAHFTARPDQAANYTSPSASSINVRAKRADAPGIFPVFLRIERPFDTRIPAIRQIFETEFFGKYTGTPLSESGLPDWTDSRDLLEWIEETGQPFDGLILDEGGTPEGGHRGISYVPVSSEQIKSATGNRGTFDKGSPSVLFQGGTVTPAQDAEYMDAVKRGDTEAAQRMVDEAAKRAGYGGALFHGGAQSHALAGLHEHGKATYAANSEAEASKYGPVHKIVARGRVLSGEAAMTPDFAGAFSRSAKGIGLNIVGADLIRSIERKTINDAIQELSRSFPNRRDDANLVLLSMGYSGESYLESSGATSFAFFDQGRLKSADPITYDDSGNVIPLSKRFNETSPDIRFQSDSGTAKGSIEFLEDGRAIIRAFESADVSTLVHEIGHLFRRDLAGPDLAAVETWAGVEDGNWTVPAEEKFARGFERYLADGQAPTPELRGVFEKLKDWLLTIYKSLSGGAIDVEITPEIRRVFDSLLGGEGQGPPAPPASQPSPAPEAPRQTTSARKADTAADRAALGLNEIDSPERRSWAAALDQARTEGVPAEALGLAESVLEKPRALSDSETAGMVQAMVDIKNRHRGLLDTVRDQKTDEAARADAVARLERAEAEFDTISRAVRTSGTEKGRALASQKLTLDENFDLVSVLAVAKHKKGAELTAKERAFYEAKVAEIEAKDKALSERERILAEEELQATLDREKKSQAGRKNREQRLAKREELAAKARELIAAGCKNN